MKAPSRVSQDCAVAGLGRSGSVFVWVVVALVLVAAVIGYALRKESPTRVIELRVVTAGGEPISAAEILYLRELWELPYGGVAVPPLSTARELAESRAQSVAGSAARVEVDSLGAGGLLVVADGFIPGVFLLADEMFVGDNEGEFVLPLREGTVERVRVVARDSGTGEEAKVLVAGLSISSWLHNKQTSAYGHDLQLFPEEITPGLYEFPALNSVPTPWQEDKVYDVAELFPAGYSRVGAVRGEDGVFLAELTAPPARLVLTYSASAGLPDHILIEMQAAVAPAEELLLPSDDDWPTWYVFGARLDAGQTVERVFGNWDDVQSLVFFAYLGDQGSYRFAMNLDEALVGPGAPPLDLTESLLALLPAK